jgi:hypothetical protein
MPSPLLPYVEKILQYIVDEKSTQPFITQLIGVFKTYLRKSMPGLTDEQFDSIFPDVFLLVYINTTGLDIVGYARNRMQLEDIEGMAFGAYPMTWLDAIAEALRNTSWLHHSCWMSPEQFSMMYPIDFFAEYARAMGFDRLGLNEP